MTGSESTLRSVRSDRHGGAEKSWNVAQAGKVNEVLWESPAFDAGITAGAHIIAVNGRAFTAGELKQAVVDAEGGRPD